MDLSSLDTRRIAEEGVEMQLRHPVSGDPLEAWITVRGIDSRAFRDQLFENARAARARLVAEKRAERTAEEIEEESVRLLAACTVSWRGIELDGRPLECNRENALELYRRFPWIRAQLDEFVADRANFLPRCVAN